MTARRQGVGLVEVLVAAAITLALLMVVLDLITGSLRTLSGLESHLDAMHAARLALERIEHDVHRLLLRSTTDLSVFEGVSVGVASRDELSFLVAEPGAGGTGPLYVGRRVTYRAVTDAGGIRRLSRNGVSDPRVAFTGLAFSLAVTPRMDGRGSSHFVRTRLSGVDPASRRAFALDGLVAVGAVGGWRRNASFNPNPDVSAPLLAVEP